jgi:hypothetical protein
MFPFGGDEALSAGAWFDRRLEKRAAMSGNPLDEILDGLAVAA